MANSQRKIIEGEFGRTGAYAAEYKGTTPMSHFFNTRMDRVSELLNGLDTGRILDVGCGPAFIGDKFRESDLEYFGLDISQYMIRECVNYYCENTMFHFVLGSIEYLPFPDNYFDAVLCLGVLEYVRDEQNALEEITRVLKPQGLFIVTMLNGNSPYRLWQRLVYWKAKNLKKNLKNWLLRLTSPPPPKKVNCKLHCKEELQRLLTNNRFNIVDFLYYDFNLFISPLDTMFGKTSVLVSRRLKVLARSKLGFLGTGCMYKCINIKEQR
jgi:ubiquinone/menaquinone biosynthesis C-methylase UbiE